MDLEFITWYKLKIIIQFSLITPCYENATCHMQILNLKVSKRNFFLLKLTSNFSLETSFSFSSNASSSLLLFTKLIPYWAAVSNCRSFSFIKFFKCSVSDSGRASDASVRSTLPTKSSFDDTVLSLSGQPLVPVEQTSSGGINSTSLLEFIFWSDEKFPDTMVWQMSSVFMLLKRLNFVFVLLMIRSELKNSPFNNSWTFSDKTSLRASLEWLDIGDFETNWPKKWSIFNFHELSVTTVTWTDLQIVQPVSPLF